MALFGPKSTPPASSPPASTPSEAEKPPGGASNVPPALTFEPAPAGAELSEGGLAESAPTESAVPEPTPPEPPPPPEERLTVETSLYTATFSTKGGGIVDFEVKAYDLPSGKPLHLVDDRVAQPVLRIDPDAAGPAAEVSLENTMFAVRTQEANGLPVGEIVFTARSAGGATIERRYRLRADDYTIDAAVAVHGLPAHHDGEQSWVWTVGLPLTERDIKQDLQDVAAIVRVGDNYERNPIGDFRNGARTYEGTVHWAATRGKYFIAGIFPTGADLASRAEAFGDPAQHRVGFGVTFPIREGVGETTSRLYAGPIEQDRLVALGEGIDKKVGIKANMFLGGVFGWLATALHTLMVGLYKIIPNYGVAILLIAIASKLVFLPLTRKGAAQMKAMAALKPELDALRDRYKGDQQKLGVETMALYKKHGVNPAAGCLPLLIQMPVFFALYGVLRGAIELRQAPFVGWINDLSSPDILFSLGKVPFLPDNICVLPLLMAASTILMQRSTVMSDPRQRSLMYMMPVMMLFFFYNLPAGLNLYWTAQNLLSWAEQALSKGITAPTTAKAA